MRVNGRYPSRPMPLRERNMIVTTTTRDDGVTVLRVDDKSCDEFWMEIEIDEEEEKDTGDDRE